MEIEKFKTLKSDMELEIQLAVQSSINKFRKKTGMTPNYINIEMVEINEVGIERPKNYAGKVKTTVDI